MVFLIHPERRLASAPNNSALILKSVDGNGTAFAGAGRAVSVDEAVDFTMEMANFWMR